MSGSSNQRYEIGGQVYESLDEMPPDVRAVVESLLADRDGDGVPDVLAGGDGAVEVTSHSETYVVDGAWYDSIDDVPAPARAHLARLSGSEQSGHSPRRPSPEPVAPAATGTPSPIVRQAGLPGRTKLLLAFAVVDAIAVGVIAWLVLR
ncbi:MAG: hypothetical protein HKN41_13095 [Ilumatobacter sp.]|nr:hypothetical protein [Ilumatobacter sp.]